ncbi:MAG: AraC family transcriptional regulator [Acidobacteria bacterium]|nr:MAG: AraC family transcriptional regulator [Acidobacteriota bacterium]
MLVHPTPGALVWPAAMVVWGPGFATAGHRHHCVQLVMAMRGALLIRGRSGDPWMKCGAALVRPDAVHEVVARDTTVLIGFIDSESELGAALSERIDGGISCISESQVARWRVALGRTLTEARVERWVRTELLHHRRPVRIHPGVSLVLKHLREELGTSDDFSLKTLAGISGLSQSRFMHIFTESMGTPLRPYILWLRLQRACCELMGGATATAAAHNAGFSDAAHLTRTFRRMLGMTPTDLALRKRTSRGIALDRADPYRERINPTPTVRVVAATRTAPV